MSAGQEYYKGASYYPALLGAKVIAGQLSWYPVTWPSLRSSFWDGKPVYEIYRCPILSSRDLIYR